jgi:hypothetical protein
MARTTTPMETTAEYLEIVGYKVAAKERHEHRGRPGWLLKLHADDQIVARDAVWVDDEGPVWVLSMNTDLKRVFQRSTW